MKRLRRPLIPLAALVFGLGFFRPVLGFSHVNIGDRIENINLQSSVGETTPLLRDDKLNVIVFFRPDQIHSKKVAKAFAQLLEPELGPKPVQFVAIISDRYTREEIAEFIRESGLKMPVLLDEGDGLVGKLGVILHPTIGMVDANQILKAYQHFTEIGFTDATRGYVRYFLGEISEKELQDILSPSQQQISENRKKALRRLSMSRVMYKQDRLDLAIKEVQASINNDTTLAAAHSFYGVILVAKSDCPSAIKEFEIALMLDPNDSDAIHGMKSCQQR